MDKSIKIYSDGGSRGNPGPAACSFVAISNRSIIKKASKYLGVRTNNQAEYEAVILALSWINSNSKRWLNYSILFFLDSELVTRQLNGLYKIKDKNLKDLSIEVKKLERKAGVKIIFSSIKREENKLADKLVNETLDNVLTAK